MSVSRRTVIAVAAIVVAVALIVIFVVAGITDRGHTTTADPTSSATYTSAPSTRPVVTPSAGSSTAKPHETAAPGTGTVPGATPSATADPGTASGRAQKPVGFGTTTKLTSEVKVSMSPLKAVTGKADGVGEVSGPALEFTVTIDNGSTKLLNLSTAVVTVVYGPAKTPANEFTSSRKPFPQTVKPGAGAKATYLFGVPLADRSDVRIVVDYGVSVPSVVFAGVAPA